MASVCGGSLALMDAGVPVKAPIAGIAMGMLLDDNGAVSDENAVILSDILGTGKIPDRMHAVGERPVPNVIF